MDFEIYEHLFMGMKRLCMHCGQGSTFGTPGVEEHTNFLRDVSNASAIRAKIISNWNKANSPGMMIIQIVLSDKTMMVKTGLP